MQHSSSEVRFIALEGKGLKNVIKVIVDGKEISSPYNSLKVFTFSINNGCDVLIADDFLLDGEVRLFSNICKLVVVKDNVKTFIPSAEQVYQLELNGKISGKVLQIGGEIVDNGVMIGTSLLGNDDVISLVPFPFRDSSFDFVLIFDILDFLIVEEAERVLKHNGKAILVIKDKSLGGVNPVEAVKVLSYKFAVNTIREKRKFWIIEGRKRAIKG
ncbi:MAG: hypothetical protein OWQ54_02570 [Sulfolobaceae archaeon]|nr:hypothetical protein [Sulfolobaceae archaeon]